MSKFFKALEQAELDRGLREQARRDAEGATGHRASVPPAPRQEPSPVVAPTPPQTAPDPPRIGVPVEGARRQPETESASDRARRPSEGVEGHLVSLLNPASFEAEQYRVLRHLIEGEQMRKAIPLSILAVSSPGVGDGKTTTAVNLAGALAQAPGARVLLVDADLRRPSVARQLGMDDSSGRGLVEAILNADVALEGVVRRRPMFNLSVLLTGRPPTTPFELLRSPRLGDLLEEARRRYDYIVVDTPPLIGVPDCRIIRKWVDGFVVVVAANKTPRKMVEQALNVLGPEKIIGIVLNRDDYPLWRTSYYGYGQALARGRGPR